MRDRFNSIIREAAQAGKAVWELETDAGKWADDLLTAASQAKLDVETYQSWQYASKLIDTSVDDISKSIRKMEADLKSSNEEVLKTFNQLGVATREADGSVRDANEVFWDTVDALGRVEDATQRGIYAQTLLGSHYNTLNPLIEAGSKAYKKTADEGLRVATVSEDIVEKLGRLNDQQEKMNSALDKSKYTLLGSLAEPFEKVSEGITNASMAFNDFLTSDDGKQALQELSDALDGLINEFLGEDNGKGTFQAIVEGATGAVNAFTQAMEWIKDNGDIVKTALIGIGAVWAGLNVAPPVLEALHLIQKINWGSVSKGTADATKAAANATSAANPGTSVAAAGFGVSAGSLLQGAAAAYGLYKADEYYASLEGGRSAIKDIGYNLGLYNYTPHSESGQQIYESIRQAVADGLDAAEFTKQKYGSESLGTYYTQKNETFARWESEGRRFNKEQNLENAYAQLEKMADEAAAKLEETAQTATEKGQESAENFAAGITDNASAATEAASDMSQQVSETVEEEMSFMDVFGYNAAQGFAQGIYDGTPAAVQAAQEMTSQVQSVISSGLDIHSPSRVLMRMGQFTAEGFAEGIEDGMARVEAATARMGRAAMAEPTYRSGGSWGADPAAGQGSQQSSGGSMNATILMDKTVVGRLVAPIVNEAIGAQVAASRR